MSFPLSFRMQRHRFVGHLAVRYIVVSLTALLMFGWWAAHAFNQALTRAAWTELEAAANLAATEAAPLLAKQSLTNRRRRRKRSSRRWRASRKTRAPASR
jgi:hypothetical protein